jgi:hypothetical protein
VSDLIDAMRRMMRGASTVALAKALDSRVRTTARRLNVPWDVERRLGLTAEEYRRHQSAGEKWCTGCKAWHPLASFGPYRFKPDGLQGNCRDWFAAYREKRRSRKRAAKTTSKPRKGRLKPRGGAGSAALRRGGADLGADINLN